jgi:hypothetical protein
MIFRNMIYIPMIYIPMIYNSDVIPNCNPVIHQSVQDVCVGFPAPRIVCWVKSSKKTSVSEKGSCNESDDIP